MRTVTSSSVLLLLAAPLLSAGGEGGGEAGNDEGPPEEDDFFIASLGLIRPLGVRSDRSVDEPGWRSKPCRRTSLVSTDMSIAGVAGGWEAGVVSRAEDCGDIQLKNEYNEGRRRVMVWVLRRWGRQEGNG